MSTKSKNVTEVQPPTPEERRLMDLAYKVGQEQYASIGKSSDLMNNLSAISPDLVNEINRSIGVQGGGDLEQIINYAGSASDEDRRLIQEQSDAQFASGSSD